MVNCARVNGRGIFCLAVVLLSASPLPAALGRRSARPSNGSSKISLRKRLHINTLITEPGSVELDWGGLYSFTSTEFAMPSAFRYTPSGSNVLWGRTEYSVTFDSLASSDAGGSRLTQFSQAVTLAGTAVLHDGDKLDIAIAPQASIFLRDESGARVGVVAIARYDSGRNSTGFTASWSGATHSSDNNPAGTFDAGFGYGRQLSGSPLLEKFTPHFNAEWERSTGSPSVALVFEGFEYQITEKLAFDLGGQHTATRGASPDHQLAFGMTLRLGHSR